MNVRVNWTNSTPTSRQRPLAFTRIETRVVASPSPPWSELNMRPFPESTLLDQDVAPGDWEYRATEIDAAGVESAPSAPVQASVPFDPPSGVAVLSIMIE